KENTSTRVPLASGSTMIWLLVSPKSAWGLLMMVLVDQCWPPSVVLESRMSPRMAAPAWNASKSALSLGNTLRSQTTKTRLGLVGSVVTEGLSLNTLLGKIEVSDWRMVGAPQVMPRSADLLTMMALWRG